MVKVTVSSDITGYSLGELWKIHEYMDVTSFYIYIYAFSRRVYPKRLTVNSGYTFVSVCDFFITLRKKVKKLLLGWYQSTKTKRYIFLPCLSLNDTY